MLRLIGAFHRHANIIGLLLGQFGQLHSNLLQVQAGDLFIEPFRQTLDGRLIRLAIGPKVELCQDLVGE